MTTVTVLGACSERALSTNISAAHGHINIHLFDTMHMVYVGSKRLILFNFYLFFHGPVC